jgi:2-(1,2-epoxy-1,2-dihydrophenyl)acetyl-CoA isomerase
MASSYDALSLDVDGAVATIVMQRPERRNALNETLDAELRDAVAAVGDDDAVRAVLLRGAGPGFCAGADLEVLRDGPSPQEIYDHVTERYVPLVRRLTSMPKPVVAAVNGTAAGAGMALALACDLRVMADDARLVLAFSNIGFVPDSGASYLLARQVGYSRAFEMAATADPVDAERCEALGLANRVVPADRLAEAARDWADELAERPTATLGWTKEALRFAMDHSLGRTMEFEARLQSRAVQTDDHAEGVEAFLGKRSPTFTGE